MARNWPTYAGCTIFVQMLMACSGDPAQNNTAISAAPAQSNIAPAGDRKLISAFGDRLYAGYGVAQNESFPYELEIGRANVGTPGTNARLVGRLLLAKKT